MNVLFIMFLSKNEPLIFIGFLISGHIIHTVPISNEHMRTLDFICVKRDRSLR